MTAPLLILKAITSIALMISPTFGDETATQAPLFRPSEIDVCLFGDRPDLLENLEVFGEFHSSKLSEDQKNLLIQEFGFLSDTIEAQEFTYQKSNEEFIQIRGYDNSGPIVLIFDRNLQAPDQTITKPIARFEGDKSIFCSRIVPFSIFFPAKISNSLHFSSEEIWGLDESPIDPSSTSADVSISTLPGNKETLSPHQNSICSAPERLIDLFLFNEYQTVGELQFIDAYRPIPRPNVLHKPQGFYRYRQYFIRGHHQFELDVLISELGKFLGGDLYYFGQNGFRTKIAGYDQSAVIIPVTDTEVGKNPTSAAVSNQDESDGCPSSEI